MAGLSAAVAATLIAVPGSQAQVQGSPTVLQDPVPPPMSVPTAKYFNGHPAALAELFSQLPRRPAGAPPPAASQAGPAAGGTWQALKAAPAGLANPLLMMDGTVLVAAGNTPYWYKLTPDIKGSYVNGTWSQVASLPVIGGTQYAPLYHASGVLPDGRAIIMGGEYNGTNTEVWTRLGAIYDPIANRWTPVSAPSSWSQVGDAESVVLANGTFMLASCCSSPAVDALFNPSSLSWKGTGAPNAGDHYQDEQGYELLPNGNALTIDVWTNYPNGGATNAEQYRPASGTWASAGRTPTSLIDPAACGTWEVGPAALRPNQTLVAFGGNTGCVSGATADPTAIYQTKTGTWSSGPNVPAVCGAGGTTSCDLADAPAAVLPNGNILFAASAGFGKSPTHFFEFTGTNTINKVPDTLYYANTSTSYYYNFLVLPTGQVLSTDFSTIAEIYTPVGAPVSGSAPVVSSAPSSVVRGKTYSISGKQLSGETQGAYYGDDVQSWTNYPLVRITNTATGHVRYARTSNPSTMSVAPGTAGSTNFTVPLNAETGAGKLVVIANGVASQPVSVVVK